MRRAFLAVVAAVGLAAAPSSAMAFGDAIPVPDAFGPPPLAGYAALTGQCGAGFTQVSSFCVAINGYYGAGYGAGCVVTSGIDGFRRTCGF